MNGGPHKKIRRTFGISATFAAAEYSAQRRLKSNPQSVGWMAACVCLLASLVRTAALLSRLERTAQICRRNFQRQRPTRSGVDALSLPFFSHRPQIHPAARKLMLPSPPPKKTRRLSAIFPPSAASKLLRSSKNRIARYSKKSDE